MNKTMKNRNIPYTNTETDLTDLFAELDAEVEYNEACSECGVYLNKNGYCPNCSDNYADEMIWGISDFDMNNISDTDDYDDSQV
mgnify:CR=1 FL=1